MPVVPANTCLKAWHMLITVSGFGTRRRLVRSSVEWQLEAANLALRRQPGGSSHSIALVSIVLKTNTRRNTCSS